MADKSRELKKFMRQKSVMDSLRMNMDVSGGFLEKMKNSGTLTKEDVDTLQRMEYPAQRNGLMQILIKKQWTEENFASFCAVLSTMDNNSNSLSQIIIQKAQVFSNSSEKEREKTEETELKLTTNAESVQKAKNAKAACNAMGGDMKGLDLKQQIAIRLKMQEKDDLITQLKTENQAMSASLEKLKTEHDKLKTEFVQLDTAAQDLIASLSTNSEEDDTMAIRNITQAALQDKERLRKLDWDHTLLMQSHDKIKQQHDMMALGQSEYQQRYDTMHNKLQAEKQQLQTKLDQIQKTYASVQTKRNQLQKQVDCLQGMFGDNIRCLEHDLAKATRELKENKKAFEEAISERDATRKEMGEAKEKIRKLLFSLGLKNDIDKTGMSLEHARNIMYARRRKAMAESNDKKSSEIVSLAPDEMQTMADLFHTTLVQVGPTQNGLPLDENMMRQFSSRGRDAVANGYVNNAVIPGVTQQVSQMEQDENSECEERGRPMHITISGLRKERRSSSAGLVDRIKSPLIASAKEQDKSRPSSAKDKPSARPDSASRPRSDPQAPARPGSASQTLTRPGSASQTLARPGSASQTLTRPGSASLAPTSSSGSGSQDVSPTFCSQRCFVCDKSFTLQCNYEGACVHHPHGATKLYEGTELEVWSCCKTRDKLKGCQRSKHEAVPLNQSSSQQ